MRANKFSIGGLRGVHVSSIVNWGYEDNFKPVYLFFLRKDFKRIKTTKRKTSNFYPLRSLCEQKIVAFVVFCLLIFVLLVGFLFVSVFLSLKSFCKIKINRFEILLVPSLTYTTTNPVNWLITTGIHKFWCRGFKTWYRGFQGHWTGIWY